MKHSNTGVAARLHLPLNTKHSANAARHETSQNNGTMAGQGSSAPRRRTKGKGGCGDNGSGNFRIPRPPDEVAVPYVPPADVPPVL